MLTLKERVLCNRKFLLRVYQKGAQEEFHQGNLILPLIAYCWILLQKGALHIASLAQRKALPPADCILPAKPSRDSEAWTDIYFSQSHYSVQHVYCPTQRRHCGKGVSLRHDGQYPTQPLSISFHLMSTDCFLGVCVAFCASA